MKSYFFLLLLGGNVICLDFWGRKSGAYIHALHFCLSLGLLTGPLLVDPLSSAHVPGLLRKALPFALSHSGGGGNSAAATAAGAAAVGGTSHIIQKRSLESTLDPLLANIFGVDPNPIMSRNANVLSPESQLFLQLQWQDELMQRK